MSNIRVLDSIMGSGKTTYIFNEINRRVFDDEEADRVRFLYVSPFLSEVGDPDKKSYEGRLGRIHRECPVAAFKSPTKSPTKSKSLKRLLSLGENVCCTHKLFEDMDEETADILGNQGYEVIIDEAIEVIQSFNEQIKKGDLKYIKQSISVDPQSHLVSWTDLDDGKSSFDDIKRLCHENRLYCFRGRFFLWEMVSSILTKAKQVTICTYLFRASVLHSYLKKYSIPFNYINTEVFEVVSEEQRIKEARKLIQLVESPYIEKLGKYSMTKSGYDSLNASDLKTMKGMTGKLIRRHLKLKSSELIWTCMSGQRKQISGDGYARSWLGCSARATNDYGDRKAGIYLVDRHPHVMVQEFLRESGTAVDKELYALSEMIQWVWRLRIRNDKPIQLVIPSKRMRNLLQRWLNGEFLLATEESSIISQAA